MRFVEFGGKTVCFHADLACRGSAATSTGSVLACSDQFCDPPVGTFTHVNQNGASGAWCPTGRRGGSSCGSHPPSAAPMLRN
ncbi:hypothetical protein E2C01_045904 [Portunus trituberculatus]|uniref:Uncharacterized protein n=1 Tax=Portunus trituberculatus TaxID=210409 RepID=A0A5B7G3M0_PORTR|nr:hypothetical protein [Portunus trituberculatus]